MLVLQDAGPLGGPGMPEWGMLPIPKKILALGIRDMVRLSDARMSGTSYGTCVLHIAPESFVGGPLAFVRDGDIIELDVPGRRLTLRVSDEELARRRAEWTPREPLYPRGFGRLYSQHVTQADKGCDFDFLEGHGRPIPEPSMYSTEAFRVIRAVCQHSFVVRRGPTPGETAWGPTPTACQRSLRSRR